MSQAILLETFPPEKRGTAMAAFGLGVVVAPVLGPTLGGWITETYTWRWAFYINVPIGILAVILISRFVHDPPYIRNAKPGRLDGIGLGLLTVWLGALQIILDKGQEDDWFGATWIRWAVVILITAFIAFIAWELTREKPLVDLKIFKNRNFAVGCLLIAMFGVVIYGIVTLLPLFFQTLLGYTALAAGWAVSPRGIGAIFAMPLVGLLTERLDNRWLIATGFAGVGACTLWLGNADTQIGEFSMFWAIILSGFFIGFVFVPLVTVAMGKLDKEQVGNAAGLYNLLRNVGGSIGISVVNTLLVRRAQVHQSEIVHSVSAGSPALQRALQSTTRLMEAHADPVTALNRARKLIELTMSQQAQLWAYVDDFRYLALLCFACIPIAFTLQRVRRRPGHVAIE
jgi:DHA2 family multidrug resistance protein